MYRRIRKIADRIIDESFPLLKGKRIIFLVLRFRFYALSILVPPRIRIIVISTRTKNFSNKIITGIIAHELCHQERYIEMGTAAYIKFIAGYTFSNRIRTGEERLTDLRTIEKGYGAELYELTLISHADKKHRNIIDNYLSPEEIKNHALKRGKWNQNGL